MDYREKFSSRILELRIKAGVSQDDVAKAIGLGRTAVTRMESGERAASFDAMLALAVYFNVSLDYLVGRSDNPEINP